MKLQSVAVLSAMALLASACGGMESKAPRATADAALLTAVDLRGGRQETRRVRLGQDADHRDRCGPAAALRRAGGSAASGSMIAIDSDDLLQAVAIFAGADEARRAFSATSSARRRACARTALARLGGRYPGGLPVTELPPLRLEYGDEATLMRFVLNRPNPGVLQFVDVVVVRKGRVVSAAVLISSDPSSIDRLVRTSSAAAVARIESALH